MTIAKRVASAAGKAASAAVSAIDRAISFVAPSYGLKREAARAELRLFRTIDAARVDHQTGRRPTHRSANEELKGQLRNVRSRVRDLILNNSYISGATEVILNNVVGTGIVPQAGILDADGRRLEDESTRYEDEFKRWADKADVSGRMHFYEVQELFLRQWVNDGEAILLLTDIDTDNRRLPFAVENVEADRLADKNEELAGGGRIVQGVEMDARGVCVAYWLHKNHPGDNNAFLLLDQPVRIPAERIIHRYHVMRPGQVRGYPWYTPVVNYADALGQMLDWELTASRIQACLAAMITNNGGMAGLGTGMSSSNPTEDADGNDTFTLKPGLVWRGRPGDDITVIQPNRPGSQFGAFVTLMLRSIGAGAGLSYETLARDFTKTNFSSARASALEDRRAWRRTQGKLNRTLNKTIWREVMTQAIAFGTLEPVSADDPQLDRVFFQPPGWEWVDPKNEVMADIMAVQAGFKTRSEVCAQRGRDFYEVIRDLAVEQEVAESLGVNLETIVGEAPATESQEDTDGEESQEEGDEDTQAAA